MPLRRARLPLLAEISGAAPGDGTAWSLLRADHERLTELLPGLRNRRVVLIAGEGEPAAVVAVGLAAATAASGRRTVLVECELGRPVLADRLGLRPGPGLHEYLRWEAGPEDIVQPVILAGPAAAGAKAPLACVCAGREARDTPTLLGLGSFAHAVAKLRGAYELVVLLGPAILTDPVSALTVARQADAVIAGLWSSDRAGEGGRPLRAAIRRLPIPALGAIAVT